MIEPLSRDGDAECVHRREVGGGEITRLMDLPEHDGLARSMRRSPLSNAALKGAAMRIEKLVRMRLLEPVEERLGV